VESEALRWLSEAEWDLETAQILHREKRFNASTFYAHQSAEKAVKALLYHVNEAPWGHSIRVLLGRFFTKTGSSDSRLEAGLLACARELDRHYIPSRYPNALPAGTPHEAYDEETSWRAIECARRILEYVRRVVRCGGVE